MQKPAKRSTLTAEEAQECARLKTAWLAFKVREQDAGRHWTQESVADSLGWTQANFSHYVNGRQALTLDILLTLCRMFGVEPAEISPRLAAALPPPADELTAMLNELPPGFKSAALDSLELQLRRAQDSLMGEHFSRYMRLLDNLRRKPGRD